MARGQWTHAICNVCWDKRNPTLPPQYLKDPDEETCCFCGILTKSGIYVRGDPKIIHPEEGHRPCP